ncbi:MAG: O-antigen ligase family protein, partial [Ilumatobacter sp.]
EHGASVHLAVLFILTLCLIFLPKCSSRFRWTALTFCIPAIIVFALSQRRSAFNAFAIAMVLFLAVLFIERRRAFWWLAPTLTVFGVGYVLAFWSVTGPLGFGAQAVKSFIAPEQLDAVDRSSDLYREIEATNIWFTIRAEPELGVGFGNRFYQPWALPDLGPGFEFRDFLPHNSLLWIWLKTGYVGFVLMLFVLARTIQLGTRSIARVKDGDERAILVACLSYIVMYTVFTYVDIGWDARSVVFLSMAMAWCADSADVEAREAVDPPVPITEHTLHLVASIQPAPPESIAAPVGSRPTSTGPHLSNRS